jgi:hypothetical protein
MKAVVFFVLTMTLGLGGLWASAGIDDPCKQSFGDVKWQVKLDGLIDACSASYADLAGRIISLANKKANWATTIDCLTLIKGMPTYSRDHAFTVPGYYCTLFTIGDCVVADSGAVDLEPKTVASCKYASPNFAALFNTHTLTNNLAAVSSFATRNRNNVYGSGSVVAGDFGTPSQANLGAADAVADGIRQVVVTPGTWNISSDIKLNSPLKVMPGAVLTRITGTHFTINGRFEGCEGCFADNSPAHDWIVFRAGAVKEVYPEWWGAISNATKNCTNAIVAATNSLKAGGIVKFSDGTYLTDFCNFAGTKNVTYSGSGIDSTTILLLRAFN